MFDVDMFRALSGPLAEAIPTAPLLSIRSSKVVVGRGCRRAPDGSKLAHEGNVPFLGQLYDPGKITGSVGRRDVFSFRT
jgi:hypothetical protein